MYTCISHIKKSEPMAQHFKHQGIAGRLADACMYPLMKLLTVRGEAAQRTHPWNNQKFGAAVADELRNCLALFCPGLPDQVVRKYQADVRFHLPFLGGWRHYVVLMPVDEAVRTWYPGWLHADGGGVSMVPVSGPVRLLIGPHNVHFFGVDHSGQQIALCEIGNGKIGDQGPFRRVPLR